MENFSKFEDDCYETKTSSIIYQNMTNIIYLLIINVGNIHKVLKLDGII